MTGRVLYSIIICGLLFCQQSVFPQKTYKVKGEALLIMEAYKSELQWREEARVRAMTNAIESKFTTAVNQVANSRIVDGKYNVFINGSTVLKGQWIRDTQEPEYEIIGTDPRSIKYTVYGEIREALPNPVLKFEILNYPDIASRTSNFYNNEDFFVYFRSPVNGYLSIFIEEGDSTGRLLPYKEMTGEYFNCFPVEADRDYLFFDPNKPVLKDIRTDEIFLFTTKRELDELNIVYIVFSEKKYSKPHLFDQVNPDAIERPKRLSNKEFQKWLGHNRALDPTFQDIQVSIFINPEKR